MSSHSGMKKNVHSSWSPPPDDLDLKPYHVDVWRVPVQVSEDSGTVLESTLSDEEAERAAGFHIPADRSRYIAAHGGLRDILTRYIPCEPRQLQYSSGQHGKPALTSGEGIEFNLSHSADYALIAIAQGRRVGVDVERIRPGISSFVIAQQYFSKAEVAELQALPIEQRVAAFFDCWTRKEAYIKAQGLGLSLPLESFDVSLSPQLPPLLRATRPNPNEAARWVLHSLEVDSLYAAALAVEKVPPQAENESAELRLWQWTPRHPAQS